MGRKAQEEEKADRKEMSRFIQRLIFIYKYFWANVLTFNLP